MIYITNIFITKLLNKISDILIQIFQILYNRANMLIKIYYLDYYLPEYILPEYIRYQIIE